MNFYSLIFKKTGELLYDIVEFEDNGVVVIYCPQRKDIRKYDDIDSLKCVISELNEEVVLIKDGVIEEEDNDEEEEIDDEKQIEQLENDILKIRDVIDRLRHRGI